MLIYVCYYAFIILLFYLSSHVCIRKSCEADSAASGNPVKFAYSGRKAFSEKLYVNACVIALILILGLRNQEMGRDLPGYLLSYDIIGAQSWDWVFNLTSFLHYEKGFVVWMKICHSISSDGQFFLFACAAVSIYPLTKMWYNGSRNTMLSIIVFLGTPIFLMLFSALRQAMAFGFIAIAYTEIQNKRIFRFLVAVILASIFHTSALIFVVAYPVYWIKLGKKAAAVSVALLPILYILRVPIFILLTKVFYRQPDPDYNDAVTFFAVLSLIYAFCAIVRSKGDKHFNGLMNLFFVGCAIQSMGGVYFSVVRLAYYYLLALTLLLPELAEVLKKHQDRRLAALINTCIYLAFIAFGLYSIRITDWAMSYPYYFYWETIY